MKRGRELQKNDPMREFQIGYGHSYTLIQTFPVVFAKDNCKQQNKLVVINPGEGKYPENLIFCQNWDVIAFSVPHPKTTESKICIKIGISN